jgi:hypothetical protein
MIVVTGCTDLTRPLVKQCRASWGSVHAVIVGNGQGVEAKYTTDQGDSFLVTPNYLGTVPAFRQGVDYVLDNRSDEILCCLHDDLEILDPAWVSKVEQHFRRYPKCGLLGFGGAIGLGSDQIYKTPYDPMQLARIGFRSNLVDAENHGMRSLLAEQVACLDGFSLIGRRDFFLGLDRYGKKHERPWTYFEDQGLYHHAYDSLLGAYAKRLDWEVWYLPIRCKHYGGQTAVGDKGYQAWALTQIPEGDKGFWLQSHQRGYDLFQDVLPIRV